jgi:membrane-associated protein
MLNMANLALGPEALDPNHLILTFGLIGVLAIVFAESGLLIGFIRTNIEFILVAVVAVSFGPIVAQVLRASNWNARRLPKRSAGA